MKRGVFCPVLSLLLPGFNEGLHPTMGPAAPLCCARSRPVASPACGTGLGAAHGALLPEAGSGGGLSWVLTLERGMGGYGESTRLAGAPREGVPTRCQHPQSG